GPGDPRTRGSTRVAGSSHELREPSLLWPGIGAGSPLARARLIDGSRMMQCVLNGDKLSLLGSPMLWISRVLAIVVLAGCAEPAPQKTIFEVTVALTPEITSATADGMAVPISGSMIMVTRNYDSYVAAEAAAPMEIKLVGATTHTGHAQTGQCALIAEAPD